MGWQAEKPLVNDTFFERCRGKGLLSLLEWRFLDEKSGTYQCFPIYHCCLLNFLWFDFIAKARPASRLPLDNSRLMLPEKYFFLDFKSSLVTLPMPVSSVLDKDGISPSISVINPMAQILYASSPRPHVALGKPWICGVGWLASMHHLIDPKYFSIINFQMVDLRASLLDSGSLWIHTPCDCYHTPQLQLPYLPVTGTTILPSCLLLPYL